MLIPNVQVTSSFPNVYLGYRVVYICSCFWRVLSFLIGVKDPSNLSIFRLFRRHPFCMSCAFMYSAKYVLPMFKRFLLTFSDLFHVIREHLEKISGELLIGSGLWRNKMLCVIRESKTVAMLSVYCAILKPFGPDRRICLCFALL